MAKGTATKTDIAAITTNTAQRENTIAATTTNTEQKAATIAAATTGTTLPPRP